MSSSIMRKHYLRIINHWPKDLLRPDVSFQNALRKRIANRFPAEGTETATSATSPATAATIGATELAQVNALYSLLENRYDKAYPLSDAYLRPTSNPSHYTDLLEELDAAPKRSWLGARLNKWKGFLRFS